MYLERKTRIMVHTCTTVKILWKSRKKIRSCNFDISWSVHEKFLETRYEYANKCVHFVHRNPIFQLWENKTCLISTLNKWQIMLKYRLNMICAWGRFYMLSAPPPPSPQKNQHLIFISSVQKNVSWKIMNIYKFIPSFFIIQLSPVCEKCTLSI